MDRQLSLDKAVTESLVGMGKTQLMRSLHCLLIAVVVFLLANLEGQLVFLQSKDFLGARVADELSHGFPFTYIIRHATESDDDSSLSFDQYRMNSAVRWTLWRNVSRFRPLALLMNAATLGMIVLALTGIRKRVAISTGFSARYWRPTLVIASVILTANLIPVSTTSPLSEAFVRSRGWPVAMTWHVGRPKEPGSNASGANATWTSLSAMIMNAAICIVLIAIASLWFRRFGLVRTVPGLCTLMAIVGIGAALARVPMIETAVTANAIHVFQSNGIGCLRYVTKWFPNTCRASRYSILVEEMSSLPLVARQAINSIEIDGLLISGRGDVKLILDCLSTESRHSLRYLWVRNASVDDNMVTAITRCPNLSFIDFGNCTFSESVAHRLIEMDRLYFVRFINSPLPTGDHRTFARSKARIVVDGRCVDVYRY